MFAKKDVHEPHIVWTDFLIAVTGTMYLVSESDLEERKSSQQKYRENEGNLMEGIKISLVANA